MGPRRSERKKTLKRKYVESAEDILGDMNQPIFDQLTSSDIFEIFNSPEAQATILEKRPDLLTIHQSMVADPGIGRRVLADFQRDGRSGYYHPDWQSQAREALQMDADGKFDEYRKWKVHQDWPRLKEIQQARARAEAEAAEAEAEVTGAQAKADSEAQCQAVELERVELIARFNNKYGAELVFKPGSEDEVATEAEGATTSVMRYGGVNQSQVEVVSADAVENEPKDEMKEMVATGSFLSPSTEEKVTSEYNMTRRSPTVDTPSSLASSSPRDVQQEYLLADDGNSLKPEEERTDLTQQMNTAVQNDLLASSSVKPQIFHHDNRRLSAAV